MSALNIVIGEKFYNKDPQSTELGRNIFSSSILLLDEVGYEEFTFKKLATRINSTEASIYRYFDNKHKLLLYLTTWYWAWMEYMIDYKTHFIKNPKEKLREILKIICHCDSTPSLFNSPNMDISALKRLVSIESDKTYLTKQVDEINSQGLFKEFKSLCHKIALVIEEIDPSYPYSHSLVSTILEASHQQAFFSRHLPALTEIKNGDKETVEHQVFEFVLDTVNRVIQPKSN